ncbi:MAG: hypothetical protein J4F36_13195 [Nitrosopumilaceae archaeon]|nr:hypothetical protein [Nitrosopumilaceae archaeon]
MVEYKVKVSMTCKTCNGELHSTVPDEISIQGTPNTKPIKITIEELKGYAVKKYLILMEKKLVL